jgi:glyoxylase-like metal-dependent hydrolase (beta-lactamase superfamily II)
MAEPKTVSQLSAEVVPGISWWWIRNEMIGGYVSSAHSIATDDGTVLIDPLPLVESAFAELGRVHSICLTTSVHQRSAWRLRRELGVPVFAPGLSRALDEEPDERYEAGDRLPAGLLAIFTPGAGTTQHSLLLEREGGVLFTPDLFAHEPGEPLSLVPAQYMHDPEEARRTAEKLLDLDFAILCTGHGAPVTDDPKTAIRAALAA